MFTSLHNLPHAFVAAADFQRLSLHWAYNKWLVLLGVALAGVSIVYLYRAQRRVASQGLVRTLTGIRLALVFLVLVLFAGPVLQRHSHDDGPALWLLVDQSMSMDQSDRQTTPAERLRWADELGWLPEKSRPGRLNRDLATLLAIRADFKWLESRSQLASADSVTKQLQAEIVQLRALANRLKDNPPVAQQLTKSAAALNAAVDKSTAIPWAETSKQLDSAIATLTPLADEADKKFLAAHQHDPAVQAALAKVAATKRLDLAVAALSRRAVDPDVRLIDAVDRRNVTVVAFADAPAPISASDADAVPDSLKTALKPAGHSTDLAGALRWVSEQIGPGKQASVVVLSDGRQNAPGGDLVEPARALASRGVRVFTAGVGSSQIAPDATIEQVDAPDWIYKDDTLHAGALLRLDGLAGKPVTVGIKRAGSPRPPTTQRVTPGSDRETKLVTFDEKPADVGALDYEISILPVPGETVPDNNARRLRVTVKKEKLNALVIDDQPRWEYRYLVNYLERDQRVKLQKVLLSPATIAAVDRPKPTKASPNNPSPEANLLPETPAEWAAFDLIVLGDVPPERLSDAQQSMIAQAVKDRGAALVLIAGANSLPSRYGGTALAGLMPVDTEPAWSGDESIEHLKSGYRVVMAPEGAASILSRFSVDETLNSELWSTLPAWFWHADQTRTKLAASAVWAIGDTRPGTSLAPGDMRRRALLATMPMGTGRVLYLASDSTWRLRQVGGHNLHERFWGQVVRWAVGDDLPAGGRFVKFGADKPRYVAGESATVTARLVGADMTPLRGKDVKLVAKLGDKQLSETPLVESAELPGTYRATLSGLPAGRVELSLAGREVEERLAADPNVVAKTLSIDVMPHRDDERANVNADPAALARIAEAGGGVAVAAPDLDVLVTPVRSAESSTGSPQIIEQAGLFGDRRRTGTWMTHWAFLAIFVGLLTCEWVIRKRAGLV